MSSALAPVLIASLARLASLDADVGLRADARSTTVDAAGAPTSSRTSLSTVPSASAILDAWRLRLVTTYSPRFWTSDVEARTSPLVDHAVEARLRTYHELPWQLEAFASAVRGNTDPLAAPLLASAPAGSVQVATTRPLAYEEVQGGLGGEAAPSARTTLRALGTWRLSRAVGSDADLLPLQRGVSIDASVGHLVTERDTLRIGANATGTLTDAPGAPQARSAASTVLATWRRRLTEFTDGWLGGGASWLYSEMLPADRRVTVQPAGEAGLSRTAEGIVTSLDAAVRATTFIDRFTGEVSPSVDGRCGVALRATAQLSFSLSASGGSRTDGVSAFGAADVRASWLIREALTLDVGAVGRWQHESRPDRPSFLEAGLFASVAFRRERVFGSARDVRR